jgi:hypothetical protein
MLHIDLEPTIFDFSPPHNRAELWRDCRFSVVAASVFARRKCCAIEGCRETLKDMAHQNASGAKGGGEGVLTPMPGADSIRGSISLRITDLTRSDAGPSSR